MHGFDKYKNGYWNAHGSPGWTRTGTNPFSRAHCSPNSGQHLGPPPVNTSPNKSVMNIAANNYAASLVDLKRFEEARSLLRKTMPMARRVLGGSDDLTLRMRLIYARALYRDDAATLDDLREAVTTLEDTVRIRRRVFGGTNPLTVGVERSLRAARAALVRNARAVLGARETPSAHG